jgi:Uma2 family endonuclease
MAATLDKPKPPKKRWTYEEYYRLDDDRRYELDDGELIPMTPPSPTPDHQDEALELAILLRAFVRARKLGKIYIAPLDVVFSQNDTAQPDIIFVSNANSGIVQKQCINGAPDLVVEIVSPGSIRRDRYDKLSKYARFRVKEYWIVDQANRSLEVLTLEGKLYAVFSSAEETGHVTSKVLPGLKVRLSSLFQQAT